MNNDLFEILLVTGVSIANILLAFHNSARTIKPQIHKMQAEEHQSFSSAAESSLDAAKVSNELLMQRIAELKKDRQDLMAYIAILKKQLVEEAKLVPVPYTPRESDPKIPKVIQ